jgi:hypothetical protein
MTQSHRRSRPRPQLPSPKQPARPEGDADALADRKARAVTMRAFDAVLA